EARRLKNSFYETEALSKNALTASKAYTEIAEALRNASKATSKAKTDAEDAYGYADPNSDKSLVNKATSAIEKSKDLEEAAKTTNNKDNEESLNRIQTNLDNVKLVEADIEKNISWIKDVHLLLDDHHDRINTVHNTVVQAQTTLADVQKRAENFAKDVEDLQKRAEAVGNFNEQTIRDEIENVTKSAAQISDSLKQLDDVRNRAEKHDEDMTEIRKDLSVLKEKIKEAREMAAKVKIAVKSEAKDRCVREYISPAHPSPSNTISLKYQPALDVPDSLLFLTMIEKTRGTLAREFIAIELKERRIIVHWNIGSGNRKATNSHNIGHIAASNRYTWYHIDVKRNGNSMKISVAQKDTRSGESAKNMDRPTEITVGEPDATNDVILNTEPGKTRISIGHSSPTLASELGLATHQFNGVLNELTVDGQNVPLWVFASQNGNCDGSAGGPKPFVRGHMFRDGFAQILMPMTERRDTSISIDFSAYSPNGLLYFRGSQETHDFIAIQLHNGGVELVANFGQDSKVVASSTKTSYADGRDHKITTHRRNNTIHLRVDSEDDHVSVAVPNDSTLDINYDVTHFVGGVPPDFDKAPFSDSEIQWNGFFGCVQSVKLNQNPELDLDNPMRSQRKEPGCESRNNRLMPTDRVIGFSKAGYLISSGIELSSDSSVSFNFRTRNSNAVLMYQSGRFRRRERRQDEETDKTFFAFYLFNGRLIVHLGTDSLDRTKRPSLTSTNSYNDGRIHSVFIARVGPKIEVRVDDREVLRTEFSDLTTIGSSGAQLFLGGFPEKIIPKNKNQDMGTSEPLIGCLSDFYYNYEKMPVIPESHQATLGYCAYDDELAPESAMTQDTCSNIQDTTKSPSVSGVRYGVSSSSHSRINFRNDTRSYPDPENFKLTFSFRTVKKNGMLWVWANYKFYTRYFYLNMEGGFLSLEAKGHKQPKIQRYNAKRLNDNEWHRVDLRKQGREVRLQVDNLPPQLMKDMPSPKVMKRRMYVGGVISRHKKNFTLPFDGFVGCIRNFEVDDQVCDLVEASRDVIPCADTQGVAYVHSGGYASFGALREFGLNPTGTDFNIRFRSSQPNGLILSLLSNANHTTARLTTHIENRGVVFNALLVKYGVDISQRIDFTICDNQWHEFSVLLGTTHFILRLDDIRREIPVQIPSEAIEVFRSLPVHVGGVSPHVASIHKLNSTEGCFKDLQLSGVFVPFEKAKRTNKVVPDGCPYI
uniref:Laminin G domain-containing protein n=1 Tax=Acrobeloides nanus TaxID=290746 RepID=A0A914BUS5_9BILA